MIKRSFFYNDCCLHFSDFKLFYLVGEKLKSWAFFLPHPSIINFGNRDEMRFRVFMKKGVKEKNMMVEYRYAFVQFAKKKNKETDNQTSSHSVCHSKISTLRRKQKRKYTLPLP